MNRISVEDLNHILEHTSDLWESFRGKSILLTGGTGFFGKWFLESFLYINEKLNLNATITTITRNPDAFLSDYPFYQHHSDTIIFLKGDILNFDFNLINKSKFNYIIHAATSASDDLNKNNPLLMMDTITVGTRRVLDFSCSQPIESFLFISSGAVYGSQPFNVSHIRENDSFNININNTKSAYAEGKRIAELYCSSYYELKKLPVKIARCFAFVGPFLPLDAHFAIGNIINNVLKNEDIIIKSDGTAVRSYLYASDLMIWLLKILICGDSNSPYNVGSDEFISINDLAIKIKKISNSNVSIKILGSKLSKENVDIYCPNISKARTLNAYVNISLEESINKTLQFYNY